MNIEECIEQGYLRRIKSDDKLIEKEFREADYDLSRARDAIGNKDFKWAIIKSYYSMFHAARAVLFSLGYREKKHFAVQVVLEDLHKRGKLERIYLDYFSAALDAREGADYRYTYSKETAEEILKYTESLLQRMKKL